jgi:DNA (cytosine-5)-methyltransferase 1
MRVAGFFSGVGGLELGFQGDPWQTVLLCENDPVARHVLKARFGLDDAAMPDDVSALGSLPPGTDIVVGGFPCQDVSSVGQKAGMDGGRSSLISQLLDLVEKNPPEWVVLENVAFMLKLKRGQVIRYVTERLAEVGYRWAYRTVNTQAFGLPQRRRRVFIVASRNHDPKRVLYADEAGPVVLERPTLADPVGFYWTEGTYATGLTRNGVPPLKAGSTIGIPSPPAVLLPDGTVCKPSLEDAEALQGFERGWTSPGAEIARKSLRWRLVGNAVSVPVPKWVAGRILDPGEYDSSKDPLFNGPKGWPSAAWGDKIGEIRISNRSDWPVSVPCADLRTYLTRPYDELSIRATTGFLKRLRAATLWRPEGFDEALDAHLLRMKGDAVYFAS